MKSRIMRTTTLLFGLFLSLSINAQITIDFNSGTGLAPNTDYGSNVITVGNFKFTYNHATWFGSTLGSGGTIALEAITTSTASGQSQSITVETNDGSEFDFQSFWVDIKILTFTILSFIAPKTINKMIKKEINKKKPSLIKKITDIGI